MRESRRKRLTRSGSDRIIAGVFGGFGQYFNCSANFLRVAYVILSILSGIVPGVIIYIIMVLHQKPERLAAGSSHQPQSAAQAADAD